MRVRLAGRHVVGRSAPTHRQVQRGASTALLKKGPVIGDGSQSREETLGKRRSIRGSAMCHNSHTCGKSALSLFGTQLGPSSFARLWEVVWRLRTSNHRKPGVVMSIIPLDVQRRCERRWAARFSRPTESVAARNQLPERQSQQIAGPDKSKRKARRAEPGSRLLSAV
jgi:hypothetical protein